jgi:hypothetical protein
MTFGLFIVIATAWGNVLGTQIGEDVATLGDCFAQQTVAALEFKDIELICVAKK